jgi:hypothetical protein
MAKAKKRSGAKSFVVHVPGHGHSLGMSRTRATAIARAASKRVCRTRREVTVLHRTRSPMMKIVAEYRCGKKVS